MENLEHSCEKLDSEINANSFVKHEICKKPPPDELQTLLVPPELSHHNQQVHTGLKLYPCQYCDRSFTNSTTLKNHLRVHTPGNPYSCQLCNKSFLQSSNLKIHMRSHSGEKNYKCSQCDKSFLRSQELTVHLRVHTGEKPYKCTVCDKSFAMSANLKQHLLTHSGVRPYRCEFCNRGFTQSSNLKSHISRRHSGEVKLHTGEQCGDSCSGFDDPQRHAFAEHNADIKPNNLDTGTTIKCKCDFLPSTFSKFN